MVRPILFGVSPAALLLMISAVVSGCDPSPTVSVQGSDRTLEFAAVGNRTKIVTLVGAEMFTVEGSPYDEVLNEMAAFVPLAFYEVDPDTNTAYRPEQGRVIVRNGEGTRLEILEVTEVPENIARALYVSMISIGIFGAYENGQGFRPPVLVFRSKGVRLCREGDVLVVEWENVEFRFETPLDLCPG